MIKIHKDGQTLNVSYGVYKNTFAGLGYKIVKDVVEEPAKVVVEKPVEEKHDEVITEPAKKQTSKGGKNATQNRK